MQYELDKMYAIAVISNPVRYVSRYSLYEKFKHTAEQAGFKILTVEIAFGDRPFIVTQKDNPWHLQMRTWDEMWHKEAMINGGINYLSQLAPDWKYVAWLDADIEFVRKDIVVETVHQLQHYHFVQMWQNAIDLGPTGEAISTHTSFMYQYVKGKPYCYGGRNAQYYSQWHPGFAWAARREALDHVGCLIDTAIMGAGDNHMAHALVGKADITIAKGLHPNYNKHISIWQQQAEKYIRRDVGYVPGTLIHSWHGRKKDRGYHDRWRILVDYQYDPYADLKRDSQGLYQLVDHGDIRSIQFRDAIRRYFRSRNEDSIDLF